MRIICPVHAKERMELRKITEEQVEQAVRNPDILLPTLHKGRKRVMKQFGFKTLDVFYEPRGEDKIVLVTAVWLKKKDRKTGGE